MGMMRSLGAAPRGLPVRPQRRCAPCHHWHGAPPRCALMPRVWARVGACGRVSVWAGVSRGASCDLGDMSYRDVCTRMCELMFLGGAWLDPSYRVRLGEMLLRTEERFADHHHPIGTGGEFYYKAIFEKVVEVRKRHCPHDHASLAQAYVSLGKCLVALARTAPAVVATATLMCRAHAPAARGRRTGAPRRHTIGLARSAGGATGTDEQQARASLVPYCFLSAAALSVAPRGPFPSPRAGPVWCQTTFPFRPCKGSARARLPRSALMFFC